MELAQILFSISLATLSAYDARKTEALMTTPLSQPQINTASEINDEVERLLKIDADEALLRGMLPLMGKFKPLMDDAKPGQLDLLCDQFLGFGHFAKLLEAMAMGIADGNFNDVLDK
jgi:hypothetical protein